jgi:predicted PhzF superfamily epimerase YddE/YHI9
MVCRAPPNPYIQEKHMNVPTQAGRALLCALGAVLVIAPVAQAAQDPNHVSRKLRAHVTVADITQHLHALEDIAAANGDSRRSGTPGYAAARDYVAVFETEEEVRTLVPDYERLARVDRFAVIATARGTRVDFVSRFFAPRRGIPEDPVTGSAHATLVPFWSKRLGKKKLHALQVSPRGGELFCEDRGDRVAISGRAVRYLEGTIDV